MRKNRDKEYDQFYNDYTKEQLGMEYGKAMQRLFKKYLLHMAKKCGQDTCVICKQKINDAAEMSLEHIQPWRATVSRVARPELFWDLDNIALSHSWCNSGGATRGTSKNGWVGVDLYIDKRKGKEYLKYRARHHKNKVYYQIGYFDSAVQAAVGYDIGIMRLRNGAGLLNFERLRDTYTDLLSIFPDETECKIIRKFGPIQKLTAYCVSLLTEEEKIPPTPRK